MDPTAVLVDIQKRQRSVEDKLDSINTALQTLVRIEERQVFMASKVDSAITDLRSQDDRLSEVEKVMPQLKEARGWTVAAFVTALAATGGFVWTYITTGRLPPS